MEMILIALAGVLFFNFHTTSYEVKLTYYWTIKFNRVSKKDRYIRVKNMSGGTITWAPRYMVNRIIVEGSGYLPPSKKHPKGLLINLGCECKGNDARFIIIDRKKYPWGMDAQGNALVPWKTIAVDPEFISLGSRVYVPVLDGVKLPSGKIHNGCLNAVDSGWGIKGKHIDIFTGKHSDYRKYTLPLNKDGKVKIIVNDSKCDV